MHQQICHARCMYKRVKEMDLSTFLLHSRNILYLKSIDAKCLLFVTLNFLFYSWSKRHLHEILNYYFAQRTLFGYVTCHYVPLNFWLALLKHCLYHLLQLNNKKALSGENNFTDTMRHMLSSRLSMPDCPNCNYRRRWADVFSMKS